MRLHWRPMALSDRAAILEFIAADNPGAAIALDDAFEAKAEQARLQPKLYKPGRQRGTREIVVRDAYVMIYRIEGDAVVVLRVLHGARQWPPRSP